MCSNFPCEIVFLRNTRPGEIRQNASREPNQSIECSACSDLVSEHSTICEYVNSLKLWLCAQNCGSTLVVGVESLEVQNRIRYVPRSDRRALTARSASCRTGHNPGRARLGTAGPALMSFSLRNEKPCPFYVSLEDAPVLTCVFSQDAPILTQDAPILS